MKRSLLLVAAFLFASVCQAQPVRCAPGFQDSACRGVLLNAPQTPPACDASPGWKTVTPARWIGSRYADPQCSYTAAPTCPAGFQPSQNPTWNGSEWVGLACVPIATPSCPSGQSWNGTACVGPKLSISHTFTASATPLSCAGAASYHTTIRLSSSGLANKVYDDGQYLSEGLSYACIPVRVAWGQWEVSTLVWGNGAVTDLGVFGGVGAFGADFSAADAYARSLGCEPSSAGWRGTWPAGPTNVAVAETDQSEGGQTWYGFRYTMICPDGVNPTVSYGGVAGHLPPPSDSGG